MTDMGFYYLYPPPYITTFIPKTFPEHHHPFEHTRHNISQALHMYHPHDANTDRHTPRSDIRETEHAFYIDVELPGVDSKEHLKLEWTSRRTLFLEARIRRSNTTIEGAEIAQDVTSSAEDKADENGLYKLRSEAELQAESSKHAVHLTAAERKVGLLSRAFDFPVDVDRDAMKAKIQYGVLRIEVQKKESEKVEKKTVDVEHGGV